MRQRTTIAIPEVGEVEKKKENTKSDKNLKEGFLYVMDQLGFNTVNNEQTQKQLVDDLISRGSESVAHEIAMQAMTYGYALDGGNGKMLKILDDAKRGGTNLGYSEGEFLGSFVTSFALGDWQGMADATEKYVVDRTLGTARMIWNGGAWLYSKLMDL
jgi:hypothetical protein